MSLQCPAVRPIPEVERPGYVSKSTKPSGGALPLPSRQQNSASSNPNRGGSGEDKNPGSNGSGGGDKGDGGGGDGGKGGGRSDDEQESASVSYAAEPRYTPRTISNADEQLHIRRQIPPVDLQADRREEGTSRLSNYFLPGEDIGRAVIQNDICSYLGTDATVRPYTHLDGRQGYLTKAYRAPTSGMIAQLKQDSRLFELEVVQGRPQYSQTANYASSSTFDDRQWRAKLTYGQN